MRNISRSSKHSKDKGTPDHRTAYQCAHTDAHTKWVTRSLSHVSREIARRTLGIRISLGFFPRAPSLLRRERARRAPHCTFKYLSRLLRENNRTDRLWPRREEQRSLALFSLPADTPRRGTRRQEGQRRVFSRASIARARRPRLLLHLRKSFPSQLMLDRLKKITGA